MGDRRRDSYHVNAEQIGNVGPDGTVTGNTFSQMWSQTENSVDLPTLAKELEQLQARMQGMACEPGQLAAVGEVAYAVQEAKSGNGPKVMEHLSNAASKAGEWISGVAKDIVVPVATEALKNVLPLGGG